MRVVMPEMRFVFGTGSSETSPPFPAPSCWVLQIDTVPAFIERLRQEPAQLDLLFRELLIGVTQFFRDPQAFEALRASVLPDLVASKKGIEPVRVWVAGCATGEEVYSIAILLKEEMERQEHLPKVQIFGADIDESALSVARAGRYIAKMAGMSPQRIERRFTKDGDGYCVAKDIREMCVFSPHSIVKDPPFSKLDLISCRNVLIYMDAELQGAWRRCFITRCRRGSPVSRTVRRYYPQHTTLHRARTKNIACFGAARAMRRRICHMRKPVPQPGHSRRRERPLHQPTIRSTRVSVAFWRNILLA